MNCFFVFAFNFTYMFSWHSFHIEAFLGETVHQKT